MTCCLHCSSEVVLHSSALAQPQLGEGKVAPAIHRGPDTNQKHGHNYCWSPGY